MVKDCRACGQTNPISEFYKLKVGHMAKCKECWKAEVQARRVDNIDAVRAYDRERARLPHRIANAARVTRDWRRKHRDRQAAHNKVARTLIVAPSCCEGCGRATKLDKHHHDYSRPLAVLWLCKPCHCIADKIRRRLEAS